MNRCKQLQECTILAKFANYQPQDVIFAEDRGLLNYVFFVLQGQCEIIQQLRIVVGYSVTNSLSIHKYLLLILIPNIIEKWTKSVKIRSHAKEDESSPRRHYRTSWHNYYSTPCQCRSLWKGINFWIGRRAPGSDSDRKFGGAMPTSAALLVVPEGAELGQHMEQDSDVHRCQRTKSREIV